MPRPSVYFYLVQKKKLTGWPGHAKMMGKEVSHTLCGMRTEVDASCCISALTAGHINQKRETLSTVVEGLTLYCLQNIGGGWLVVDRPTYDIKKFAGNGSLSALVVLQAQLAEQLVGIVGSRLHSYHAGGML